MKKILPHIVTIISIFFGNCYAQNLVPNPSFEEYNNCPPTLQDSDFSDIKNWFSPTLNQLYYLNTCAISRSHKVPINAFGTCIPRTGNAYSGILIGANGSDSNTLYGTTNYASNKLSSPLLADSVYRVSFYVSLAEGNPVTKLYRQIGAISSIGVYFNTTKLKFTTEDTIPLIPQVLNPSWRFLDDTLGWMNIKGYYRAIGGEQFITIGNTTSYVNTIFKIVKIIDTSRFLTSCYYIDDVSLTPVSLQPTNKDTSMCDGDSILWGKRPDFNTCVWNDGDTCSNRYLKQAGTYFINNISGNVSITDTITIVTLSNNNNYTPSYCNGQTLTLQAATAQSYRWNTLTTAPSILVNQPGTYWVKRSNAGCSVTDTFRVTQYPLSNLNHLTDTVVCFEEGAQLTLTVGNFKQQLWQPMGDTTASILIQTPQQITVTVTDSNTCIATKSILIGNSCSDFVFIPNAFSPNDDGLNDVFKPITRELEFYELTIVNRWGQILFTTQNIEEGWDGKNASAGVYIAHLTYKVKGKKEQKTLQSITLLR